MCVRALRHDVAKWVGYSGDGVKVTTHGAASLSADVAVLALPLATLAGGELVLNPKLPEWKADALSNAAAGSQARAHACMRSSDAQTRPSEARFVVVAERAPWVSQVVCCFN